MGTGWNPIFIVGRSLPHYLERSPFIGKGEHLNICTVLVVIFIFINHHLANTILQYSIFHSLDHLVYRPFPVFCNGNSFGACFDPTRCFYGTLLLRTS